MIFTHFHININTTVNEILKYIIVNYDIICI
jgi:hypothetical protein